MRVLLCTCAKNENNYIKEWVEHYQQLGFTNIVIYDNNDIEGETFADVLADYIKSGYVIIKNVRGKKGAQIPSFNDCYQTIAKEYDWVAFFDVDEFLEIDAGLKIDEFIQQPKFDNFNSICVCWKVFDDSNIIKVIDNNYSVKRFTHYISKDKNQNKKIVKTKIHDGVIVNSSHTFVDVDYMTQKVPEITQFVFSCNTLGQAVPNGVTIKNNTWECARLNHYRFKTIEEYITNKSPKGYATAWKNYGKDWLTIDTFFVFNDKTPEKVRFIKEYYANKNKNSPIEVLTSTNFQDLAPAKISKLNKVFGIISYLPDKESDRTQRIVRLEQLLDRLHEFWSDVPIMIIAQNWKEYLPKNDIIKYAYDKLGILTARKMLRKHFLESKYDYLIMFDDDAIIECEDKNAPKLYMAELDKYPNGFCFIYGGNNKYNPYVDSQLNLCAISRYIYEKEDMVNIDAQKSEGFEDRVFSLLLHVKYSEYEFLAPTTIRCTHFKNPNIDEYGGEVPSTWANNQKYNWLRMRENTLQIEQYILKYKELPDLKTFLNILSDTNIYQSSAQELNSQKLKKDTDLKSNINVNINKSTNIDLVVTYVDSTDKEWQKLYNEYAPVSDDVQITGKQRFRSDPYFKYWFRGVEKYMPWINNVFLVVQSYSQVPSWINTNKVKIVLHEDFIPQEYLPVFNSQAIEMFLHKIPDLSEKFLYSNDDMYFVGDLTVKDFFENNKVKTSFNRCKYGSDEDMPLWKRAIINSGMLVNKEETEKLKQEGSYITPPHVIRPYFKSKIEEVHEQYSTPILESISKFRENKNFTVYLYDFYLKNLGLTVNKHYTSTTFSSISPVGLICNAIINPHVYKIICINDTEEEEDKKRIATITKHFESQFPKLSKYEMLN